MIYTSEKYSALILYFYDSLSLHLSVNMDPMGHNFTVKDVQLDAGKMDEQLLRTAWLP